MCTIDVMKRVSECQEWLKELVRREDEWGQGVYPPPFLYSSITTADDNFFFLCLIGYF